ncbi:branchpoint-bridging protein isoform X1 [Quillaja saponaria]|uniref:Branchpoint-bridging protein isoform X1 n=1 Tax=Quillaja saponaria TaxID=32244 RepID=A0AAD7LCW7_QUISA|nr:branchpoint-bridging protein isoform X1 [Quillaja saponaria]
MQSSYEELYVHISADTFEKVDAAVSIIELLITSITGNFAAVSTASTSASGDSINIPTHNLDGTTSYAVPVAVDNHGLVPPVAEPTQTHQGQLQYSGPGFSTISSHTPMVAPSGNITSPNPSAPVLNFSSQTVNPPNMPSLFGPRPPLVPAFSSTIQNPPVVPLGPQPLRQVLQQSHMAQTNPSGHIGPPRNPLIIGLQHSLTHTNIATASIPQPPPVGSRQTLVPQPMYGFPPAPIPQRSLNPAEISSAQSGAFANAGQMAPLMVPPHRPHFQYPQTDVVSTPPPNISSIGTQHASAPTHQAGLSPGLPASSGPMRLPATNLSVNHLSGPISIPPHGLSTSHPPPQHSGLHSSISGSSPYYSPIKPPMLTVSGSGNFTFQPHRPNSASQMVSRPSSQLVPPSCPSGASFWSSAINIPDWYP